MSTRIALLALALAGAAGCARRETAVEAGNRTGVLHFGNIGEPGELDPHIANAATDYHIIPALFEGLVGADPKTLAPVPGVAERWELSADGLTWTFHLRANARWSNGEPLTAEDFLYSFRRALSPALGSQYTMLFHAVRGAEEFAAGRLADFSRVGFAVPDPRTMVITLRQPTPYFLGILDNAIWFPVHRATIERRGLIDQRDTGWTRPETFVGNGAFVLKAWRPNQIIILEKSATYWNAAHVRLAAIHIHPIENYGTQERAFRAGQLHIAFVPPAKATAYFTAHSPLLVRSPLLNVNFINVNTARPPLTDARVRRALALSLDRQRFAERIQPAQMAPAYSIIPPTMPGYGSTARLKEDVAAAQALLAAAGFPGGKGFPPLELSESTNSSIELAQAIQETWRLRLGVNISIVRREPRTHWDTMHAKQYDLAMGGWNADYADPSTFLDLWRGDGGWNFTNWSDPRYDALDTAAATALDPATRLARLQETEALLLDAMPVIPLSFDCRPHLVQQSVHDLSISVFERPDFKSVWLAP